MATKSKKETLDLSFVEQKDLEATMEFVSDCVAALKADFSARKQRIQFSIFDDLREMSLGEIVLAMIMIKSRYVLSRDLSVSDLFVCSAHDNASKKVSAYFTESISLATKEDADIEALKAIIAKSVEELADTTFEINQAAGNSINIHDMLRLMRRNPQVAALLQTKVREDSKHVEYFDGNEKIKSANKALLDAIANDEEYNCYKNLLSAISAGQFQQVFCCIGYKPEVTSSAIFPHCADTNLFYGLRNEMDYFVSAMGSRKALITNLVQVSRAGYTARKLLLLVLNQKLSKTEDCGSDDYLEITIESKSMLKRLNGRYYAGKKGLHQIDEKDERLIGKTVRLRTPVTCHDDDGICRTCYGGLAKINNFHIGVSSLLVLTEQLIQMLLSSKHLLQINPEKIKLPEKIYGYFEVDGDKIVGKKHFKINVVEVVSNVEEETMVKKMVIIDGERQFEVNFEDNEEIIVLENPDIVSKYKSENIIDVNPEVTNLFRLNVENSELSTPLKKMIHLLENEARLNLEEEKVEGKKKVVVRDSGNYHVILAEFLRLLDSSNLRSSSIAIELVLRELLRDSNDIHHRPKSFKPGSEMKFLKLTNALVNHPSAAITLAFERLNYVVENNMFVKDQESMIDGLY